MNCLGVHANICVPLISNHFKQFVAKESLVSYYYSINSLLTGV